MDASPRSSKLSSISNREKKKTTSEAKKILYRKLYQTMLKCWQKGATETRRERLQRATGERERVGMLFFKIFGEKATKESDNLGSFIRSIKQI